METVDGQMWTLVMDNSIFQLFSHTFLRQIINLILDEEWNYYIFCNYFIFLFVYKKSYKTSVEFIL